MSEFEDNYTLMFDKNKVTHWIHNTYVESLHLYYGFEVINKPKNYQLTNNLVTEF